MAKEKVFGEVLNLRIDEALSNEVKRIAAYRDTSESDAARLLLAWGVDTHRRMEASLLARPYDYEDDTEFPERMVVDIRWELFDPQTGETVWRTEEA